MATFEGILKAIQIELCLLNKILQVKDAVGLK
jgi:hypothetical protein